jgi:hypothetical protein
MQVKQMHGQHFGRLTVVRRDGQDNGGQAVWLCKCDCGNEKSIRGYDLRSGAVKSCGCLLRESKAPTTFIHGHLRDGKQSREYRSWMAMMRRCFNPNFVHYSRYGGLGITVCERWRDFRNFLADMGQRPEGKSLDRINSDGNYEPGNCRWATALEQRHNRRDLKGRAK